MHYYKKNITNRTIGCIKHASKVHRNKGNMYYMIYKHNELYGKYIILFEDVALIKRKLHQNLLYFRRASASLYRIGAGIYSVPAIFFFNCSISSANSFLLDCHQEKQI